jgi:hypothetical protein
MENQNLDSQFNQNQPVPHATAVLVLGIISIVGCLCYGIVGLICGIIALVLASKARAAYNQNPGMYLQSSYSNMKAGRICAIIGTSLSAVYMAIMIIYLAIFGTFIMNNWQEIMDQAGN